MAGVKADAITEAGEHIALAILLLAGAHTSALENALDCLQSASDWLTKEKQLRLAQERREREAA